MRILILAGTTEAADLARRIAADARFDGRMSLAGRTVSPKPQALPARIGGFGGSGGLARYVMDNGIDVLVDATHPYAAQISRNAVIAAREANVPLLSVTRAPWTAVEGDRWQCVDSAEAAAECLGQTPRRAFLAMGRLDLAAFARNPVHRYLARTIDPPDTSTLLPPDIRIINDRGPFTEEHEHALLEREQIDIIVSKNSGGDATYGKIAAARRRDMPVVMIARPVKPAGITVASANDAYAWLGAQCDHVCRPSSLRGV
ncbi:MAG: cobalt-precorrin-6A reductase [Hyphomicrobium sp.]